MPMAIWHLDWWCPWQLDIWTDHAHGNLTLGLMIPMAIRHLDWSCPWQFDTWADDAYGNLTFALMIPSEFDICTVVLVVKRPLTHNIKHVSEFQCQKISWIGREWSTSNNEGSYKNIGKKETRSTRISSWNKRTLTPAAIKSHTFVQKSGLKPERLSRNQLTRNWTSALI